MKSKNIVESKTFTGIITNNFTHGQNQPTLKTESNEEYGLLDVISRFSGLKVNITISGDNNGPVSLEMSVVRD